jgi:hypothetical protein
LALNEERSRNSCTDSGNLRVRPTLASTTPPPHSPGFPGSLRLGWQLIASQGKRGVAGEKGERGPRGDAGASGATILGWKIERERYVATPVMSDGSEGPPLELRGLFEQFFSEVR